ncbi:MAG: EcsC family protein [Gemmobacter sp.]|nr:EcsC family protein [Gemmobacter sp.]
MTKDAPVPALIPPDLPLAQIEGLVHRYHHANRGVMALLMRFGGKVEGQMAKLPAPVQDRIQGITENALVRAYGLAQVGPRLGERGQMALATLSGAAGGFAGLPGAVAELPVAVTLILRGIQEVAQEHGFDPASDVTQRETLRVFGAGGPLAEDDGINTSFLGARLTFTGPALNRMITAVVPKLAAALGQKLAAQAIPVLGAVAGAALNAAFVQYYREMAHVRFGLLELALRHDPDKVLAAFRDAAEAPRLTMK